MSTDIHSIYFMTTDGWTTTTARAWLKAHGYKPIKKVHKMGNELRYRLIDPEVFSRFTTKVLPNGTHLVIGHYGKGKKKGSTQQGGGLFDRTGFGSFLTHDVGGTGYYSGLANHIGGQIWTPTGITAGLKLAEAALRANQL